MTLIITNGMRVRIGAFLSRPELVGLTGTVRLFYSLRVLVDLDTPPTESWDDAAVWCEARWLEAT